jgi:hypothetical protein
MLVMLMLVIQASQCYAAHHDEDTLTLDDRIAKALKALAHRSAKPFKQVVNETL